MKGSGLAEGIEVFPRHNAIGEGEFGNAIRGPLGVHRGAGRRFWFYGADYTLEAQMAYLNHLRKLTEEELRKFIAGKEIPEDQPRKTKDLGPGFVERRSGSAFHILDHVGKVRRVGRNYVARCPSCANAGHDRSCDNLSILIGDPRFYPVLGRLHKRNDSGGPGPSHSCFYGSGRTTCALKRADFLDCREGTPLFSCTRYRIRRFAVET